MPVKPALRDTLVAAAALIAFALDDERRGAGMESVAVSIVCALLGSWTAFAAHEWGHLLGAKARGAVVYPTDRILTVFLFRFDTVRNDARQFLAMSYGGFLASAFVLVGALTALPLDRLSGRLTLGVILLGIAATVATEFPVAWRVARGAPLPTGIVYVSESPS